MIYVDLTEIQKPSRLLLGFKVNEDILKSKGETIQGVVNLLGIENNYVIGYDKDLSKEKTPHYHIHFATETTFEAMTKRKQRNLKEWGKSTKLYNSKKIACEKSDPYAWFGYAVKENLIFVSPDLDEQQVRINAHTQKEFKKSQLSYGEKCEKKKKVKQDFETMLFEEVKQRITSDMSFDSIASIISEISFNKYEKFLTISPLEIYTFKFMLKNRMITHADYVNLKIGGKYNLGKNIEY